MENFPLVLVIVGPTASGKSALAVKLAKKFDGEIISADSRQVYRGLDLGSGKITTREMAGISHHLLDVASPKKTFTVADFQKLAGQKIAEIIARGHLPIICGGTGFYIQAVVDGLVLPEVPPNLNLRQELKKLGVKKLYQKLVKLDLRRAKEIDANNPHRLIRAIEIATALGQVPTLKKKPLPYRFVQIGLTLPPAILRTKIHHRLLARLKQGMLDEVARLHRAGVSWKRLEEFGLEYRYLGHFLRERWNNFRDASEPISQWVKREEIVPTLEELEQAIWNFSKRQLTWFRRDRRIKWVKNYQEALARLK